MLDDAFPPPSKSGVKELTPVPPIRTIEAGTDDAIAELSGMIQKLTRLNQRSPVPPPDSASAKDSELSANEAIVAKRAVSEDVVDILKND